MLIVDDDPIMRRLLSSFCQALPGEFTPLTAAHGEEALRVLAKEKVDLVLTDVEMPVMNGCELVSEVKKLYPNMKILVMTGLACEEIDSRLRGIGVSRYIEKPFTIQSLAANIDYAFKNGYERPMIGSLLYSI
ncbi:MAG TPA: response regulator [Dissulfurispiraceae bacterium]|nr:response regulator [Dissulfurispiraceae bacterium]